MQLDWNTDSDVWSSLSTWAPDATIFHTPGWAAAATEAGYGQAAVATARWPDSRQAVLICGVRRAWGGLVDVARSGVAGGYGGLITSDPLTDAEARAVYRAIAQRYPDFGGCSNPYAPPPPADADLRLSPGGDSLVLPLAPLDRLRLGYSQDRRRAVRRYQQRAVAVRLIGRPGLPERDLLRQLLLREAATERVQGDVARLWLQETWLDSLWRHLRGRLGMAVAQVDGELAGAALFVRHGRRGTGLCLAWDRRFAQDQVCTALVEACLADAHATGLTLWDFMPTGDRSGIDRFKQSFGAQPLPVWEYQRESVVGRSLHVAAWMVRAAVRRPPVTPPVRRGRVAERGQEA